jgi:hypothetical protein
MHSTVQHVACTKSICNFVTGNNIMKNELAQGKFSGEQLRIWHTYTQFPPQRIKSSIINGRFFHKLEAQSNFVARKNVTSPIRLKSQVEPSVYGSIYFL